MGRFAIGVDFGTNSVRAVVVDCADGLAVGQWVYGYRYGENGVILDARDPNLARQDPREYSEGFAAAVRGAVSDSRIDPGAVVGIGIDTTASTPLPVDANGLPLALDPRFAENTNALAWLWKDHTAHAEAGEITDLARRQGRPYLAKCGGAYSSEWFWAKILRCARVAPEVFEAAHSWIECADFVPAWATGTLASPVRGICAAGHKAMYGDGWGGLPSADFLAALDPRLATLRGRLYEEALPADRIAGLLMPGPAGECGLPTGIPVAVGAIDAHLGAVGSGVRPGVLVKIMGTSACDILATPGADRDIPGVSGVVPGSVIPSLIGIEAGQSAVGDLFDWWVRLTGRSHEDLSGEAERLQSGQSGLLALDWNNGNRCVLADPNLSGLLVGQSLHTTAGEVYRALIEATAFGALSIMRRLEEYEVEIEQVVCCGGIAEKSPLTMQIYADVFDRPIAVAGSPHTCALGAAIFGSVVGGVYASVQEAQAAMVPPPSHTYRPRPAAASTYRRLYAIYLRLHDAFGQGATNEIASVMKELIAIRTETRACSD
ncbi:MAG TPA: ribulokinase [Fimbriimonadaceae bacterium]|nr:ribulokinase [Fimbriimonadaceae bacterium]